VYRNFYQISSPFASNGRVKHIKLHDEMGQNVSWFASFRNTFRA